MTDAIKTDGANQIAEADKRMKQRHEADAEALNWILSTQQGRRIIGNLIYDPLSMLGGGCGVNQSTFSQSHPSMAAQEGARDVSLRLLACVKSIDFNLLLMIQRERYFDEGALSAQIAEQAKKDVPDEGFVAPRSLGGDVL